MHIVWHANIYRARVQELLAIDTTPVSTKTHCTPQEEEEDGYYSSYTHFGIHEKMLKVMQSPQLPVHSAQ